MKIYIVIVILVISSSIFFFTHRSTPSSILEQSPPTTKATKKNFLYIVVDDLRPELNAYGRTDMITPSIDRLASRSLIFDRAYAQDALCGPSRNSFLTGRRPDKTLAYDFADHFREIGVGDLWTSFPQLFKRNGWKSIGAGKLYHPNLPPQYDGNNSWSEHAVPWYNPGGADCADWNATGPGSGLIWCEQTPYEDDNITARVISNLKWAVNNNYSFWLGMGLHKPHLPFQAPSEYFALYPEASKIALPKYPTAPTNLVNVSWHYSGDSPDPWTPLPDLQIQQVRRGYKAAISYMDTHVGQILDALEATGLANDTVIVFHADHGWQLGEHAEWRKMTNFELATRVPLMISVPWMPQTFGKRTMEFAELIDIMPTIAELLSVPLMKNETIDGISLVPILVNGTGVKNETYSQYARCCTDPNRLWYKNDCDQQNRTDFTHMGYSLRNSNWRYSEWYEWNGKNLTAYWDRLIGQELYDESKQTSVTDFDSFENENLAYNSQYQNIVSQLSVQLRKQFQHDGVISNDVVQMRII